MKRRLSVAISLIGDPLVVYLDEPSTVRGQKLLGECFGRAPAPCNWPECLGPALWHNL